MKQFYVYQLINPLTKLPFYVGKGSKDRAKSHLWGNSRTCNPGKDKIITELKKLSLEPIIKYVKYFDNEKIAYEYEEEMIKLLGREGIDDDGILSNISLHSIPPSRKGAKQPMSEDTKLKISKAHLGKPKKYKTWNTGLTKETSHKMRVMSKNRSIAGNDHLLGTHLSDETKQKISEALSGRKIPKNQREKMSLAKKGKTWEEIFGVAGASARRANKATGKNNVLSKKVHTPNGIFDSVTLTISFYGIVGATVRSRCLSNKEIFKEWYYV